ncbi:unnamed protein product [Arctogadus glacialis]
MDLFLHPAVHTETGVCSSVLRQQALEVPPFQEHLQPSESAGQRYREHDERVGHVRCTWVSKPKHEPFPRGSERESVLVIYLICPIDFIS